MNSCSSKLIPVKQEQHEVRGSERKLCSYADIPVVDLSSDSEDEGDCVNNKNKRKRGSTATDEDGNGCWSGQKRSAVDGDDDEAVVLPAGFLDPLPPISAKQPHKPPQNSVTVSLLQPQGKSSNKEFWKAGDYESNSKDTQKRSGGIDHVRVHPKFLHSNATSHKWALGAFAELLDNALDEACNGATLANIDMVLNQKDGSPMLLIEDDGGGMDPDRMRGCMSLGYSAKSKIANMIGQYGNGFKTSTMRLGADVIVFSRCRGGEGKSWTQSIGLLSYTFLRSTGQEDIVVPMVDYEVKRDGPRQLLRSTAGDWCRNLETIKQWSPFYSEDELLRQFSGMGKQGTRIILYNLWDNDQGECELDFETDIYDIQVRGANKDQKMIEMAHSFPNSRHYLTYKHSLRSYASILYLRLPAGFRIILRGKDVQHHNLVNDLMYTQEVTYKPQGASDINHKENNTIVVTIGFVKDAKKHIDIQGFNVYHKNRLIKPFWRIWNPAGSDGRGAIGILEANFIEPAHDKQGFERTTVMARLESRLIGMQKKYWASNCHLVGYAPRGTGKQKPEKDSPSATKETKSTEILKSSSTNNVEPVPLDKDPSPAVRQIESMVCESWQADCDIVQADRQSDSCQILPELMNSPYEDTLHRQCAAPSPQMLSKSLQSRKKISGQQKSPQRSLSSLESHSRENSQIQVFHSIPLEIPEQLQVIEQSQDLQKISMQSGKYIVGQQKSPQRHFDSSGQHAREIQQLDEVHAITSELLEQQQAAEKSQNLQKKSLQSRNHIVTQRRYPQRHLKSPILHSRENQQMPEVYSIPLEHPEKLPVAEQSEDLNKRSLRSRNHVGERQNSSQSRLDSPELHACENQQLREVHSIPSQLPEQPQFMEQSLDLQEGSHQPTSHIAGQEKSPQICSKSSELHGIGNNQLHEVHSIPLEHPEQLQGTSPATPALYLPESEPLHFAASLVSSPISRPPNEVHSNPLELPEQLQVTSHANPGLFMPESEPSHFSASLSSAPNSRPPNEVHLDQINRQSDSVVAATQISQVSTRIVIDRIDSSFTNASAITCAELGSSLNLQSHDASHEFGSSSIHENHTDVGSFHINATCHKQLEDENKQLKERIRMLEETILKRLEMEIEKNINLQAHIVKLEKELEASQRRLSVETLQRNLEENELRNKLKNARLRIQELEQNKNGFN
ncbi:hypothetical protein SUGI_0947020 [Cryptomeria japonica]|uniref:protein MICRORCHIDIA 5 n=1 Tax=Cryptomeria japonica TaxID=3369 RepID=UPI002414A2E9|nr:protein MICRORCHIDIA 5 [Cryptomeria japonica]GLJ44988.1 hypothetical protein SUGI_0947020 [Cryptomeria japonica]